MIHTRIACVTGVFGALICAAVALADGSNGSMLTFLGVDGNSMVTALCVGHDGKPMSWYPVSDGPVDRPTYVATTIEGGLTTSFAVQCRDVEGTDGAIAGDIPANDVLQQGSRVTYYDAVTVTMPRTIHTLEIGGESAFVRSSKRGVLVALEGFIQVFPPYAQVDFAVRTRLIANKFGYTGMRLSESPGLQSCGLAYIDDNGKQALVKRVPHACTTLLADPKYDDLIYAREAR